MCIYLTLLLNIFTCFKKIGLSWFKLIYIYMFIYNIVIYVSIFTFVYIYIYIKLLIFNISLLFYPATEYVSRAKNNIPFLSFFCSLEVHLSCGNWSCTNIWSHVKEECFLQIARTQSLPVRTEKLSVIWGDPSRFAIWSFL